MKLLAVVVAGLLLVLLLGVLATALVNFAIEIVFPPLGGFVDVPGGRIHVLEAGPARGARATVVLIHGASGNAADLMNALGSRLADRYRVIALDRPGQGWSDRIAGAAAATPGRQAALVAEALRRLDIGQALILGHSWGGALVPNLALDHQDVTGAILLLAPVTHPWPGGRISWYYGAAASFVGWVFTRTVTTPVGLALLKPTIRHVFAPDRPPPDYIAAARIPLALRPDAFFANAQDVAALYDAVAAQSPRYPEIRVPTAVVAGDADAIVSTDIHARAFAREVPGTRLTVLPGVGHMPHYAAPDVVVAEIDALVGRMQEAAPTPPSASRRP